VLQRTGGVSGPATHGIAAIVRNARAQAHVIEDLLDVSRITSGKLRLDLAAVSLEPVVRSALEIVRPAAAAKQIEVSFEAGADPLVVFGDPARLQQVAWNLLSNAVKFTPAAGRIQVRLERSHDHGCLVVEDTGIGIPQEFLPYLFDRFTQADASTTRPYAGLGLGLAIARHLVELHGGSIKVKSDGPGHGATFSVEVPLARTDAAPVDGTTLDASPSRARLKGCHVLVVDDDAESREVAAAIIGDAGGTAVLAASAAEGLDYAESSAFDVVICDIGMPHEDGYTFIRRLRAARRPPVGALPAIALTGYAGRDDARRALEAGFDLHLAKPIAPDALVGALAGFFPRRPRP
jgi:CheY-like chemotaxis protein/two-component sensor histidine kinase